ncbi:BF2992 family fimbrillin-A clan protein [Bacteroides ihuae]|uniref:BF2992 family fimbrillin-A clan protein n=1 Tax=Bacteroides ihuae TaxID=1852362 RepID=UPI0008D925FA|nr:fimbrillin family protein [Bacteroides ihuae]
MNKYLLLLICLLSIFSSCSELEKSLQESKDVKISFSVVESSTRSATTRSTSLTTGTTVRILVYQRSGTTPDLAMDTYVTENTYVMKADGSLSACVTDDNGNKTSDLGTTMYLRSGTYDFYAVTPALKVTRSSGATVSVDHGKDYATSLTGAVNISDPSTAQSVTLATLDRKCAQLVFKIDRGAESVTSVIVDELALSEMATAPLTGNLAADLPAAATNSGTVSLAGSAFTADATNAWKVSGSVAVLPKSSTTYGLTLTARFNGSSTARTMTTTVPAIAFEKGMQYTYTLQLYGDKIVLSLSSTNNWNANSWSADAVGDGTLKNLSVNTSGTVATANCYIVNTANQDYKFKATVMGNGATTPAATSGDQIAPAIVPTALSPATAFVIWETGSKGDVIQDGSVKLIGNGYVTFKTANNSTNGNAVIGVKDAGGNVIWSWHIWKTTYAPNVNNASTYDTYVTRALTSPVVASRTFKMMKYNLGATEISNWSGTATNMGDLGLFYQWGRKDPFLGAAGWTYFTTGNGSDRIKTTNTPNYEWQDGRAGDAITNTVTGTDATSSITYSIEYPTRFICGSSTVTLDWLNVNVYNDQRDNLWGNPNTSTVVPNSSAGSKSIYDPCPSGWRTPRQDSFTLFSATGQYTSTASDFNVANPDTYNTDRGWIFNINSSGATSFWPASGYISWQSGALFFVGTNGFCWSSSSYFNGAARASYLVYLSSQIYPFGNALGRANGQLIRCAQEE